MTVTSDNLKDLVRPLVFDAAESINYATGFSTEHVAVWFERLDVEDVQSIFMGVIQDAIVSSLKIDMNRDYSE